MQANAASLREVEDWVRELLANAAYAYETCEAWAEAAAAYQLRAVVCQEMGSCRVFERDVDARAFLAVGRQAKKLSIPNPEMPQG